MLNLASVFFPSFRQIYRFFISPKVTSDVSRFINLTLISECKGINKMSAMQNLVYHKVHDLLHASFFTHVQ